MWLLLVTCAVVVLTMVTYLVSKVNRLKKKCNSVRISPIEPPPVYRDDIVSLAPLSIEDYRKEFQSIQDEVTLRHAVDSKWLEDSKTSRIPKNNETAAHKSTSRTKKTTSGIRPLNLQEQPKSKTSVPSKKGATSAVKSKKIR